jgi:hypothetical protein
MNANIAMGKNRRTIILRGMIGLMAAAIASTAIAAPANLPDPIVSGGYAWDFTLYSVHDWVLNMWTEKKLSPDAPDADWDAALAAAKLFMKRDEPECRLDSTRLPKDDHGWYFWVSCPDSVFAHP